MPETYDLVIAGGEVFLDGRLVPADIGVAAGRIAAVAPALDPARAGETIAARGLAVLPGVLDTQVHFREPGAPHKEDLETGSRAAVMGGVTAVFEMPNTQPPTISAEALEDKLARAAGRMHCDHAFFVGGTQANAADIPELERLPGAAGIKIFMGSSTGDLLVPDDAGLAAILSRARRRVSVHAEDEARLEARKDLRVAGDPASHPVWRDAEAALLATRRLVGIARSAGARVHVLHVSTAEEMAFLRDCKDVASVEATPQHLTFAAPDYARLGTRLQMNPPVREERHRQGVWAGVLDGTVDILGSDHAPHTLEEKARPYPQSPSGMPGVQTLVPVMLTHVAAGRLSLARFVGLASEAPARLFGVVGKGRITAGHDADFTIVDLKREATITDAWIASRAAWTPYHGMRVTGWPVGTIVRGHRVMWEGDLMEGSRGAPLRFAPPG